MCDRSQWNEGAHRDEIDDIALKQFFSCWHLPGPKAHDRPQLQPLARGRIPRHINGKALPVRGELA